MDVPRLTEFAKKYFECDSLEGVEINSHTNDFVNFIAGSHFNSRMIRDDIMAINTHRVNQLTEFTMYLLESTGWYKFDHDMVGVSLAGRGSGCGYVNEPCVKSYNSIT